MKNRSLSLTDYHAPLVLDTGELVNIKCPDAAQDQRLDSLEIALKLGAWWVASLIEGCSVDSLGTAMQWVNMRRVVGMA